MDGLGTHHYHEAFGEAAASGPAKSDSGDTLRYLRELVSVESRPVFDRFVGVLNLPASGIGVVACLDALVRDVKVLQQVKPEYPIWLARLATLLHELLPKISRDADSDRFHAKSLKDVRIKAVLTAPHTRLPIGNVRFLRAARAIVFSSYLSRGEPLANQAAQVLLGWLTDDDASYVGDDGSAILESSYLRTQRTHLGPDTHASRLLTHLIGALDHPPVDPFSDIAPRKVVVARPQSERVDDAELEMSDEEDENVLDVAQDYDPLRSFKSEILTTRPRRFSGVATGWEQLHPKEVELTLPRVIAAWSASHSDEGLISLLTLLSRVMPAKYSTVPLSLGDGAGLWLDLDKGCLCWNIDEVIASDTPDEPFIRSRANRFVRIPLPIELVIELRKKAAACRNASSLADLFDRDLSIVGKSTKSMLRGLALTSHRPTLTRLSRTWARYILSYETDEAYSAAIGVDFTVGTIANFNYLMLRASRVESIAKAAYRRVGLSGEIAATTLPDVGSLRLASDDEIATVLSDVLCVAKSCIETIPPNLLDRRLFEISNQVVAALYVAYKLLTGSRPNQEETTTRRAIDPETGIAVTVDKRTSPYHSWRGLALPPHCQKWIKVLLAWFRLMSYRMRTRHPDLSRMFFNLACGGNDDDAGPLFPMINSRGEVLPIGSSVLSEALSRYHLEPNVGRHWVDAVLREAYIDSGAIMAWQGRGVIGQEAFGIHSLANPIKTLRQCADAIQGRVNRFALPAIPTIGARDAEQSRTPLKKYKPRLLRKGRSSSQKVASHFQDEPPFTELSVLLSGRFIDLFRTWRCNVPPTGPTGVALSLILEDGVFLYEELIGVLEKLSSGPIFSSRRGHFADSVSDNLGIRRVYFSSTTLRLAECSLGMYDAARFAKDFNRCCSTLLSKSGIDSPTDPSRLLMECARDFHAFRTPSALFGWMRGDVTSRTQRPESLARHIYQRSEFPTLSEASRKRARITFDEKPLYDLLANAERCVIAGAADRSVLAQLRADLKRQEINFEESSLLHILYGYCAYLATVVPTVATLQRYLSEFKAFIQFIACGSVRDIGLRRDDWLSVTEDFHKHRILDDKASDSSTRAAVNHFLDWQSLDLRMSRRKGPPPAAFKLIDCPSQHEISLALQDLDDLSLAPGDLCDRAWILLALMNETPFRWDEITGIRLSDVHLKECPHIVVSEEAAGEKKSDSAPRVTFLSNQVLIERLKRLESIRAARFKEDLHVVLFGDADHPRHREECEDMHELILIALRKASGSAFVHVRDTRRTVFSREIHAALSLDAQETMTTLELRQRPWQLSDQGGHADFRTTLEEYAIDLDWQRRQWVTTNLDSLQIAQRIAHISGVTGIPAGTYRQRKNRAGEAHRGFDLLEGFGACKPEKYMCWIKDLEEYLVPVSDKPLLPLEVGTNEDMYSAAARFIGLSLLGEEADKASLVARISARCRAMVVDGIGKLDSIRGISVSLDSTARRHIFLNQIAATRLPLALGSITMRATTMFVLASCIVDAAGRWRFKRILDLSHVADLVSPLSEANIRPYVRLRDPASNEDEEAVINALARAGVTDIDSIPDRHFPRGAAALVGFKAQVAGDIKNWHPSTQAAFIVSTSLLAAISLHVGESNEEND